MHERKRGTLRSGRSGKKVTSRKQAIAIGLSEARRAGAKVPKKRGGQQGALEARLVPKRSTRGAPRRPASEVKQVVARQRAIQRQVARAERAHPTSEHKSAMQAGARRYPAPPLPRQHQKKPGRNGLSGPRPCMTRRTTSVRRSLPGKLR
jgi:hypothetical protein